MKRLLKSTKGKKLINILTKHYLKDAIKSCLKRSSLSLQWIYRGWGGNIPLISEVDVIILKEYVIENAFDGAYVNVEDIVEKANFLRKQRFQQAFNFLTKCNC